ncbi:MAG TPA: LUD domain-containing protein [Verrucomicrobiae bacterium]|nr:LUD domain-containing protein [Verrucomicrobiae bacterium]
MSEREDILSRVREALTVAAPFPGEHDHGDYSVQRQVVPRSAAMGAREWLPPVGPTFEDQVKAFAANAVDLKADFHLLDGPEALAPLMRQLRDAEGWKRAASHEGDLTKKACDALALPVLLTDRPYDVNELESCDVAITGCDALVAQTGSVLVTGRSAGGRALSVLPPHHVVLARRDQLVPDLPAAFELLQRRYEGNYPSFISFITGPSRTGDIERILVLGAHGPKKLTIVCI